MRHDLIHAFHQLIGWSFNIIHTCKGVNMKTSILLVSLMATFGAMQAANASVIDFNTNSNTTGFVGNTSYVAPITSNSFTFSQNLPLTNLLTSSNFDASGLTNGTVALATWGLTTLGVVTNGVSSVGISMSATNGSAFSLQSFQFNNGEPLGLNYCTGTNGTPYDCSTSSITVTGNLVGGGTVTQVLSGLSTISTFTTQTLTGFNNLSSVTFVAFSGNVLQTGVVAQYDNFNVTVNSNVPVPATYSMMGLGLGLMGFMIRRKKSA